MLSPLVETDEDDDDDDDASSTALGLVADGSDATTASTTALAIQSMGATPPALTTALSLPADESDFSEEGDVTDAGSNGNDVGLTGGGATDAPSIPLVQQSTPFPIF